VDAGVCANMANLRAAKGPIAAEEDL
jgi:hypothetical protein